MTPFEKDVRLAVYTGFRQTGSAPTIEALAAHHGATREATRTALQALADAHAIALEADGESLWMAHPFSAVATDFVARVGGREWYANCVWDGLSIVGLFGGTGRLDTRSPATGTPLSFEVVDHQVNAAAIVHFLVPAKRFWDDIGFT